jgi:hypothetical protein
MTFLARHGGTHPYYQLLGWNRSLRPGLYFVFMYEDRTMKLVKVILIGVGGEEGE